MTPDRIQTYLRHVNSGKSMCYPPNVHTGHQYKDNDSSRIVNQFELSIYFSIIFIREQIP